MRTPERERLLDVLHRSGISVARADDDALEVDDGKAERLGELAAEHRIVLHELSPQQASLEEAFMRLTAGSVEYHAHAGGGPAPLAPPDAIPTNADSDEPAAPPWPAGTGGHGSAPGRSAPRGTGWGADWPPRKRT
jgi:ABC-2 type transport system ATP-binding protein